MASEYSTSEFRKGLKIELEGHPYIIVECQHVKPGKGVAFVKTRYKSLLTGSVLEKNFRSGDKAGVPDLESKEMSFLYREGDDFNFMDSKTYDQVAIPLDNLGGAEAYLIENMKVEILFYQGRPMTIELPNFVVLGVIECDPGVRGDTATNATKPAKVQTGHIVNVPLFVEEGDRLRIDTRTGEYVERSR